VTSYGRAKGNLWDVRGPTESYRRAWLRECRGYEEKKEEKPSISDGEDRRDRMSGENVRGVKGSRSLGSFVLF